MYFSVEKSNVWIDDIVKSESEFKFSIRSLECVSDCCLTPTQQIFSYIMARTS